MRVDEDSGSGSEGGMVMGRARAGGFTLVEVVVAIGILAVAVLPLIALMALGVQANRESAYRSRATLIAESIFSELRQSSARTGAIVRVRPDGPPDGQYWSAPKSSGALAGKAVYLAYDQDGQVVQEYGQGAYEQGAVGAPLEILAMVKVSFEDAASGGRLYRGTGGAMEVSSGLIKVVVSVEFPVPAGAASRFVYPFVSYMNLTDRAEASAAP